jgi:hypothetical protein
VQLHRKFADRGLVVASLDVDRGEWEEKGKVLDFLKKQDATFANFIFKDKAVTVDDWKDKHDANATPVYLVWDRAGQKVKLPFPPKADVIEKILGELLDAK